MTDQTHRDQLEELPPSALLVYRVLKEEQPQTQQEIREESFLCKRTCNHGLNRLDEAGLIESRPKPDDARQTLYSLV